MNFRNSMVSVLAALSLTAGAFAASAADHVRGTIEKVDGNTLTIKTREGPTVLVRMADNFTVAGIVPAKLDDIKSGSYVGTAAILQPDGTLKALEVLIFPEAMRGAGEGHRVWDLLPESTMTNATVADTVKRTSGQAIVLKYKDGEKTVIVPPEAPIVTIVKADAGDLKPGAKIFISAGQKQPDGNYTAPRIAVGLNGLTPPM